MRAGRGEEKRKEEWHEEGGEHAAMDTFRFMKQIGKNWFANRVDECNRPTRYGNDANTIDNFK